MENLWELVTKVRGVELNEEFSYSCDYSNYKYRISEKGLEIYEDGQWYSSSLTNDRVPVLCTSTTNNLFYKLYRRRDSYGKICKAKNTASCAKSV